MLCAQFKKIWHVISLRIWCVNSSKAHCRLSEWFLNWRLGLYSWCYTQILLLDHWHFTCRSVQQQQNHPNPWYWAPSRQASGFSLWYDSAENWITASQSQGGHSNHKATELVKIKQNGACKFLSLVCVSVTDSSSTEMPAVVVNIAVLSCVLVVRKH